MGYSLDGAYHQMLCVNDVYAYFLKGQTHDNELKVVQGLGADPLICSTDSTMQKMLSLGNSALKIKLYKMSKITGTRTRVIKLHQPQRVSSLDINETKSSDVESRHLGRARKVSSQTSRRRPSTSSQDTSGKKIQTDSIECSDEKNAIKTPFTTNIK